MNRIELLNTNFNLINPQEALSFLIRFDYSKSGYVCFPDTFVLTKAYHDPVLRNILNSSLLTLPDGKPLEFWARLKGHTNTHTVSGYWLVKSLLETQLSHFFYGGNQETIELMRNNISRAFPNAKVLGYKSPPFLNVTEIEGNDTILRDISEIKSLKPDIIWIGISSPKQDYLMYYYSPYLDRGLMLGVGGVFDYISGQRKKSPEWIKAIGFRWLYRFYQDPRKLWKKYFYTFYSLINILIYKTITRFMKLLKPSR